MKNIISKKIAMTKIKALATALAMCGIESDIYEDEEHDIIGLCTHLWDCTDGSSTRFEVYAEGDNDYEIDHYVENEKDRERWGKEIEELLSSLEE